MRAYEFLIEREMTPKYSDPLPKASTYPDMPSSSPYDTYRFGMGMADHTKYHENGPAKNKAVTVAYSRGEDEIIAATEKKLGQKSELLANDESKEQPGTNTTAPVAKKKKNRYGV